MSVVLSPAARRTGIPWYLWCAAAAVTSAYIGGYWDISWHRSIGRDTFWSPPHIAIYACGVLAGLAAAYLILTTTFGRSASLDDVSVRIWTFRGPLGAFICAWGGLAMLVSAPFDDWWHNAYGLDVKIISPPHMVLAAGFFGINFGAVMLMLAFLNRADAANRSGLQRLFLYVGSMAVCESLLFKLEYISRLRCTARRSTRSSCSVRSGSSSPSVSPRATAGDAPSWRPSTASSGWRSCGSFRCFPPHRSWGRSTTR